jgi:DNA-binding IclR family transcriptional regulator
MGCGGSDPAYQRTRGRGPLVDGRTHQSGRHSRPRPHPPRGLAHSHRNWRTLPQSGDVQTVHASGCDRHMSDQTPEICSRAVQLWCKQHNADPPRDLEAHLTRIKRRGYEERKSYEVKGVINITFPVLDDRGYAIAALTVPFIQRIGDPTTPARVRRVLKEASSSLSKAIAGTEAVLREKPV